MLLTITATVDAIDSLTTNSTGRSSRARSANTVIPRRCVRERVLEMTHRARARSPERDVGFAAQPVQLARGLRRQLPGTLWMTDEQCDVEIRSEAARRLGVLA